MLRYVFLTNYHNILARWRLQADQQLEPISDPLRGHPQPVRPHDRVASRNVAAGGVINEGLQGKEGNLAALGHGDKAAPQIMDGHPDTRGIRDPIQRKSRLFQMATLGVRWKYKAAIVANGTARNENIEHQITHWQVQRLVGLGPRPW